MKIVSIICVALFVTVIVLSFISLMRKFVLFIVKAIIKENCKIDIITETILIAIDVFGLCIYFLS